MKSFRLLKNDETLKSISDLLTESHVFANADGRIHSFYGVYKLFEAFKSGAVRVYGSFDSEGRFLGICFGQLEADKETFAVHVMFHRAVRVVDCALSCADVMIAEYAKEGVSVRAIAGYIPEFNRAAIRMAKRFGCIDEGISETETFIHKGAQAPCRILKKYVR